jgi:steroid delta-isomerase-like uncharacterized protein
MRTPKELVDEFFRRVWSPPHDLDAIDELMTEDYEITTAGTVIKGRENFKAWVKAFHEALTDAENESLDVFSDEKGEKVVSRWVCAGLNNGIFGLPADQKPVSFTGIAIWKIRDGRFSECWVERSAFELYKRLSENNS